MSSSSHADDPSFYSSRTCTGDGITHSSMSSACDSSSLCILDLDQIDTDSGSSSPDLFCNPDLVINFDSFIPPFFKHVRSSTGRCKQNRSTKKAASSFKKTRNKMDSQHVIFPWMTLQVPPKLTPWMLTYISYIHLMFVFMNSRTTVQASTQTFVLVTHPLISWKCVPTWMAVPR